MAKIPQTNEEIAEYVTSLFNKHVEKGNKTIQELIDTYRVFGYEVASNDGKNITLKMFGDDAPDITIEINERYFDEKYLFDNQDEKPYILHDPTLNPNSGIYEKY